MVRLARTAAALLLAAALPAFASALQEAIDGAPEGSTVRIGAGVYEGPILIKKPLSLVGEPGAIVRGNGTGTVITVKSGFVTISGLTVEGSGRSHQMIDSGIAVHDAVEVKVRDCVIRDCLFGVNFEGTNRSLIEGNTISSKNVSLGIRGDGIRLWYSYSNIIRRNLTEHVRDNVFWYSGSNQFEFNEGHDSRYSVHCMHADRNRIAHNRFTRNSTGIFLMFSQGSHVTDNFVAESSGSFGIGIGLKDSGDALIERNTVIYNGRGFYFDQSPDGPNAENRYRQNKVFYNSVGISMHGILYGSRYEANEFKGNIDDVVNETPASKISLNVWNRNKWDAYEGFDRNRDGYGDTPHKVYAYADRIWNRLPAARIFYGSAAVSLINFLWRLMPLSEPELVAQDDRPVVGEMQW